MKKLLLFIAALIFITFGLSFAGCFSSDPPPLPDFNADVEVVAPEDITTEHFVKEEGTTYYTSSGFSLMVEVNGAFFEMEYFSLDGNKRVYDNIYFYKEDYFFIVTSDYKYLYASLSDSANPEYVESEKQMGEDVQVNVKKTGIYKIIFDVDTLKFDVEYKAEITTPVYYTIKNCSIYSIATQWVEMSVNPENSNEFVINNFHVDAGKDVCFFNNLHVSNYKVTLAESCNEKLASARKTQVTVNVGGDYNIYINAKTYVVRLELVTAPENAQYSCVYYDGTDFITLSPVDTSTPYIFHKQITTDVDIDFIPKFHTANFKTYKLTVLESSDVIIGNTDSFFKTAGTYNLEINLKDFTLRVERLTE